MSDPRIKVNIFAFRTCPFCGGRNQRVNITDQEGQISCACGAQMTARAVPERFEAVDNCHSIYRKIPGTPVRIVLAEAWNRRDGKEFSNSEYGEGVKCGLADAREYIKIAPTINPEGGRVMEETVIFVKQKDIGRLIVDNLFSEKTEKFYNNCAFTSDRQAFMQGMNYAALLCSARLDHYPAVIRHEEAEEGE